MENFSTEDNQDTNNVSSSIEIVERDSQLVVDSRIIASALGITHKSLKQTIREYQTSIEQRLGKLAFHEDGLNGANPETFYYLNEKQSNFLMALSRNTSQVVEAKMRLVEAFDKAKTQLTAKSTLDSDLLAAIWKKLETVEEERSLGEQYQRFVNHQRKENPGLIKLIEGASESKALPPVKIWFTAAEWAMSKGYSLDIRQKSVLSNQAAAIYKNFKGRNPNVSEGNSYIYSSHEEYILAHAMYTTFNVTYELETEIQGLEAINLFDLCAECGVYIPDNQNGALIRSIISELLHTAIRNEELPRCCQYSSKKYYPLQIVKDFLKNSCNKYGGIA